MNKDIMKFTFENAVLTETLELTTVSIDKVKLGTLVAHDITDDGGYYDVYDKDDWWMGTRLSKDVGVHYIIHRANETYWPDKK